MGAQYITNYGWGEDIPKENPPPNKDNGDSSGSTASSKPDYSAISAQLAQQANGRIDTMQQDLTARRDALAQAYNQSLARLKGEYDSMYANLLETYNLGTGQTNQSADKALKEAYINRMMQQRNLNQNLSAMGKAGGASETTMLNLANNYGTQRGEVERARANNLAGLAGTYNTNMAQQQNAYNQNLNTYELNRLREEQNLEQYYQSMIDGVRKELAAQQLQLSVM